MYISGRSIPRASNDSGEGNGILGSSSMEHSSFLHLVGLFWDGWKVGVIV